MELDKNSNYQYKKNIIDLHKVHLPKNRPVLWVSAWMLMKGEGGGRNLDSVMQLAFVK